MKTVDVIVPCYNYGHYLEGCVQSVLTQEGVQVRVFIADDCSPDATEEVGRRLAARDARVHYRRHAVNIGHIATYNEVLAEIDGDYCIILSADDMLTPGALHRAVSAMERMPDVVFTYGPDLTFTDAPPLDAVRVSEGFEVYDYEAFLTDTCRRGHTVLQSPSVLVRTSVHKAVGFYRPDMPHAGDTEVWLRLAAQGRVCALEAHQAFRRVHATNMSVSFSNLRRIKEQYRALAAHFEQFVPLRPEIAPLLAVMRRRIFQHAFWLGVDLYKAGRPAECDEALAFVASTLPEMTRDRSWRLFRWKRRLAPPAVWRLVDRVGALAKG
jgi:glycosyltransferase involved in cell wall biosynthesis